MVVLFLLQFCFITHGNTYANHQASIKLRSNYICYNKKTNTTTRINNSYENKLDITKDLNLIDSEDKNVCYQKIAVIPHTGDSGKNTSGHYTCNIKE